MKLLPSRAGLQPRQNCGSNRFLSSPKRLNRVFGPYSPHSVVIRGSFFLWGDKKTEREPNDLAAPSSEAKKELRISHYSNWANRLHYWACFCDIRSAHQRSVIQCDVLPALHTTQTALRAASLGQRVCWQVTPCRSVGDRFALISKRTSVNSSRRRRRHEPSKRLEAVTQRHGVTPVRCTNCSHIPIPLSRVNFQQIQRAIWQSAHCILLKYWAFSVKKERTAEMWCAGMTCWSHVLCAVQFVVHRQHEVVQSQPYTTVACHFWQNATDCPAKCEKRGGTLRCTVVYQEGKKTGKKITSRCYFARRLAQNVHCSLNTRVVE